MPAQITIERALRDEDDASGQSVRRWKIEAEGKFLTVKLHHGDGFLLIGVADLPLFIADLNLARESVDGLQPDEFREVR